MNQGIDSARVAALANLIRDTFRIRENHDAVFVDIGGIRERVRSRQHQIIFGRRGSGKSSLFVNFHRDRSSLNLIGTIYINIDEVKKLHYPDILIRLLLAIFKDLPQARWSRRLNPFNRNQRRRRALVAELTKMLDRPEEVDVQAGASSGRSSSKKVSVGGNSVGANLRGSNESSASRTETYREKKIDILERHLQDYKAVLKGALSESRVEHVAIMIDDYYLVTRSDQPDVLDYLHRLTRGTNAYLKIGTIRHRTSLVRHSGQTVGVELNQDVEPIDLDKTFQDFDSTRSYLQNMLDSLGRQCNLYGVCNLLLTDEGLFALSLASGGVPRDYLTVLVSALDAAGDDGNRRRLTPTQIYRAAASISYRTKLNSLGEDAADDKSMLERVYLDLHTFCLKEKKKTAFLISQDEKPQFEREHDLIQQLMDLKLIHVVEPDTSAASGRPGRYEAYTLDASSFMHPRRRNIEIVEFWKTDEQRRKVGIREAPTYPLERVRAAVARASSTSVQSALEEVDQETIEQSDGLGPE